MSKYSDSIINYLRFWRIVLHLLFCKWLIFKTTKIMKSFFFFFSPPLYFLHCGCCCLVTHIMIMHLIHFFLHIQLYILLGLRIWVIRDTVPRWYSEVEGIDPNKKSSLSGYLTFKHMPPEKGMNPFLLHLEVKTKVDWNFTLVGIHHKGKKFGNSQIIKRRKLWKVMTTYTLKEQNIKNEREKNIRILNYDFQGKHTFPLFIINISIEILFKCFSHAQLFCLLDRYLASNNKDEDICSVLCSYVQSKKLIWT